MADKSPRKHTGKKSGKTIKEKRAAKKLKRGSGPSPFDNLNRRQP
jgi:hypothetical protein